MGKLKLKEMQEKRNKMLEEREAINLRMTEIEDKVAAEKREMTADEKTAYAREQANFAKNGREIAMMNDAINASKATVDVQKSTNEMLREALQGAMEKGGKTTLVMKREWTAGIDHTAIETGGMVPLTIKDIIPPLEMGLVFDKVGIAVETGVVGNIQWPKLGTVEASVVGEKTALTDTTIDLSKIEVQKNRVGLTIPVDNQAINDTNTDLVSLIKKSAQEGVKRLLNRVMFSHQNFTSTFHGPFAGAAVNGTFAGTVPTFKELMELKGKVAASGVNMEGFCYVMTETLKATLEATPIDAGSGRMIVENGNIAGYPVYCTEFVNYGSAKSKDSVEHVVGGVFSYIPVNQYGEMRMIVDPYTRAKEDIVQITLNSDWSITTLEPKAFLSYKCGAGA